MIFSPIYLHLRGGMARVGGVSRQALHLLRPRYRQRPVRSVGTVVQLNGVVTATAWIQCMDLLQSLLPGFKFKVEIFKLLIMIQISVSFLACACIQIYLYGLKFDLAKIVA